MKLRSGLFGACIGVVFGACAHAPGSVPLNEWYLADCVVSPNKIHTENPKDSRIDTYEWMGVYLFNIDSKEVTARVTYFFENAPPVGVDARVKPGDIKV